MGGSVEPLRRNRWEGTAERDHSTPKAAAVKANYCGEGVNAASDGAFAKITSFDEDTCYRKTIAAVFNEGHYKDGDVGVVGVFPEGEEILTGNTLDKATTSSLFMSEACRRCHGRGVQSDNLIYVRHLQCLFHMSVGPCQSQLSSRLLHLAGRHHDDPNSSAIDVRHAG
jgi:hypothetical protein